MIFIDQVNKHSKGNHQKEKTQQRQLASKSYSFHILYMYLEIRYTICISLFLFITISKNYIFGKCIEEYKIFKDSHVEAQPI